MDNPRRGIYMVNRNAIKVLIILLLLGLNGYLILSSRTYNCDKCEISFKNTKVQGVNLDLFMQNQTTIKINALDLFSNFKNDKCAVMWSRTRGYYENS